jgi:tetratricopeptide (TPR) repeat protein
MGDEARDSCLSWYERALAYFAGETDPLEWQAHFRAGAEYLRLKRHREAREALLKSATLRPESYADHEVADYEYRRQPLELLADCYAQMGQLGQARDALGGG